MVLNQKDNQPIERATVRAKSGKAGTYTDKNGRFRFSVPATEKTLVVSLMGMTTVEVPVGTNLKVMLKDEAAELENVVVVGYMTRKVANTSASVVKVSAKQIEEKPTANPFDAIQGKVAGLQVYTSSGEPSAGSSMALHGVGSFNASSSPLFIVDGMPVSSGNIQAMNPNDFESMQFLKDAAATSIYGARAANGVVYITTKRGKAGERAQITVRGQKGISRLANRSFFRTLMRTGELLDFWEETGFIPKKTVDTYREKYGMNDTFWDKYYLEDNKPMHQADIALSGGAGSTNYYVSAGTLYQEGLRAGSDYAKYNMRVNLNSGLNRVVKFGLNSALSYDISHTSPYGGTATEGGGLAMLAQPFYTPYDKDGKEYEEVIPGWGRYNPKYRVRHTIDAYKYLNLNLGGNVTITPITGLTMRSQVGMDITRGGRDYRSLPSAKYNKGIGTSRLEFSNTDIFSNTNTIEYRFTLNDVHGISALVGHEYNQYRFHGATAQGKGMEDDRLILLSAATKDKEIGESIAENAFLSYFLQASYSYDNKYFVDAVLRQDNSSKFGRNKRSGIFGSVGLLWKAKKEAFLTDSEWINDLDVKFSIGTQGNDDIGNYSSLALVGKSGQYEGNAGWALSSPGNPDLSWEDQRKTTIGITGRVFDRLLFNVELYDRLTSNMLMDVPMPYTTGLVEDGLGFASLQKNIVSYQNRGVDLRLDYDILKGKDYALAAFLNFNYNKDKVISLFQGRDSWILPGYGFGYIVGQPQVFVYPIFKGINPDNGYPEWYLPGENIADITKDKVTSEFSDELEQNTGIRRFTPMTGGFGLNGSYKGIYFQADFSFALGKHMISNDKFFFENPKQFAGFNTSREVKDYWKKPGDNAKYPGLEYLAKVSPLMTQFDSRMIENASFMRLKNFTVGYNLPKSILSKQDIIKGVKLYVTGRNLLTFTKFTGPDPEVNSNLSMGTNPNTMQFTVGTELTF